jgi:hypothetical protein
MMESGDHDDALPIPSDTLPPEIIARRVALLTDLLRAELARRWPERYAALAPVPEADQG